MFRVVFADFEDLSYFELGFGDRLSSLKADDFSKLLSLILDQGDQITNHASFILY